MRRRTPERERGRGSPPDRRERRGGGSASPRLPEEPLSKAGIKEERNGHER